MKLQSKGIIFKTNFYTQNFKHWIDLKINGIKKGCIYGNSKTSCMQNTNYATISICIEASIDELLVCSWGGFGLGVESIKRRFDCSNNYYVILLE